MAIISTEILNSFEPGDPAIGTSQVGEAHGIRIDVGGGTTYASEVAVGSGTFPPAREQNQLMRALVKVGDSPPFNSNPRAEYQHPDNVSRNSIAWYGWSTYIPTNWDQREDFTDTNIFRIITQWHEAQQFPPYSMHLNTQNDGKLMVRRAEAGNAAAEDIDLADIEDIVGKWLDFYVSAKWSINTDGWFHMWMSIDGADFVQVVNKNGLKTLPQNGSTAYSKQGLYVSSTNPTGLVYFDWWKTIVVDDEEDYSDDVKTPGSGGGGGPTGGDIVADTDDVECRDDGSNYREDQYAVLSHPTASIRRNGGLRFTNLAIPAGSTINSAHLRINGQSSGHLHANMTIWGVDEDNAETFNSTDRKPYSGDLTFTSASVVWGPENLSLGYNNSPDISTIVQEIVDRDNWASGNAMAFVLQGGNVSSPTSLLGQDFSEEGTTGTPELVVNFTAPASADPPEVTGTADSSPTNSPTFTPTVPNTAAAGDRLIYFMRPSGGSVTEVTPSDSTGWTAGTLDEIGSDPLVFIWVSPQLEEGFSDPEFTRNGDTSSLRTICISVSNLDNLSQITFGEWGNEPSSGSSTNAVIPGITVPEDESIALAFISLFTGQSGAATLTGYTAVDSQGLGFTNSVQLFGAAVNAGAISDLTATLATAHDGTTRRCLLLALSPETAIEPPTITPISLGGSVLTNTIRLSYDVQLDATSIPATSDFTFTVGGEAQDILSVQIEVDTVVITLVDNTSWEDVCTLSYTPGTNKLQHQSGGEAASLTNLVLLNLNPIPTPPIELGRLTRRKRSVSAFASHRRNKRKW